MLITRNNWELLLKNRNISDVYYLDLTNLLHSGKGLDWESMLEKKEDYVGQEIVLKVKIDSIGHYTFHFTVLDITREVNMSTGELTGNKRLVLKCEETGVVTNYQANSWSSIELHPKNKKYRGQLEVAIGCQEPKSKKGQEGLLDTGYKTHFRLKSTEEVLKSIKINKVLSEIQVTPTNIVNMQEYRGLFTCSGVYLWYSDFWWYIGEALNCITRGRNESTGECMNRYEHLTDEQRFIQLEEDLRTKQIQVTHIINLIEDIQQVMLLYFTGEYGYWSSQGERYKDINIHKDFETVFISWTEHLIKKEVLDIKLVNDLQTGKKLKKCLRSLPNVEFKLAEIDKIYPKVTPTKKQLQLVREYRRYKKCFNWIVEEVATLLVTICDSLDWTLEELLEVL